MLIDSEIYVNMECKQAQYNWKYETCITLLSSEGIKYLEILIENNKYLNTLYYA